MLITRPQCPVCTLADDVVAVGIHLMDKHHWDYEQAQDWIRDQEESCER